MKKTTWLAVIACGVALTAWAEGDYLKTALGNPCFDAPGDAPVEDAACVNPPSEDLVNPLYEASLVPVTMSPILCDRAAKVLIVLTDVGIYDETPDDVGVAGETPDLDCGIKDETPDEDVGIYGETPDD